MTDSASIGPDTRPDLPELPLGAWEASKTTLHLWAQIVGKVRLRSTAPRNHWWHASLYPDVRGLTTRRMQRAGQVFAIDLDLIDHRLVVRAGDGRVASFELTDGLSVAAFDERLHATLAGLGLDTGIIERPYGVPMTTPFPADVEHASYDPKWVNAYWRVLSWVDGVFEEFAGWYQGKQSPVHLFWHSFDLAVTRFSGRPAAPPGEEPDPDPVAREAYSHEVVSFGFWPGDATTREPTFYAYTSPEPDGLTEHKLRPAAARWTQQPGGSQAHLAYEAVRTAPDPRLALLAFLHTAYEAGAGAAYWDREALRSTFAPGPEWLDRLGR